jgi:Phytanoyl-CoA dioxygenase (PhyH)
MRGGSRIAALSLTPLLANSCTPHAAGTQWIFIFGECEDEEEASRVPTDDATTQLREEGVALLRKVFATDSLIGLKDAADRCFEAMHRETSPPERYRFNPISNSLLLTALLDFGCRDAGELVAPLSAPGLEPLFTAAMCCPWICNMEQSWLRKKFAPHQAPSLRYHDQGWHQDGALGVRFPAEPGSTVPMTRLLTCWIPLNPCGADSPGLEFIRRPQPSLLHFTELGDTTLRQRFPQHEFWAPALEPGDSLVFLNSVLHRTSAGPQMRHSRVSIEYRIFPA